MPQTPRIEQPNPQVPSTAVGEPKLPGTPSAQTSPTAQTPRIEEPKPQPHEVSEPKKATTPSDQPSATSALIAAQGFVDKNLLAPLIIAIERDLNGQKLVRRTLTKVPAQAINSDEAIVPPDHPGGARHRERRRRQLLLPSNLAD